MTLLLWIIITVVLVTIGVVGGRRLEAARWRDYARWDAPIKSAGASYFVLSAYAHEILTQKAAKARVHDHLQRVL